MDTITIGVRRKTRRSEKLIRGAMIGFAVLFLLQAIVFSRGFMLPCFCMAIAYFIYAGVSKREYEYTLEDERLFIDRVSDHGRARLHEIPFADVEVIARPDAQSVAAYRKGGSISLPKHDYTSYDEDVPYYTVIAREDGKREKLLLDLTREAIAAIRRKNPACLVDIE